MAVIVPKNKLLKIQASENIIYYNQNTSTYVLEFILGLNLSFAWLHSTIDSWFFSDQLIRSHISCPAYSLECEISVCLINSY